MQSDQARDISVKSATSANLRVDLPAAGDGSLAGPHGSASVAPTVGMDRLSSFSPLPQRPLRLPGGATRDQLSSMTGGLQGGSTSIDVKAPLDLVTLSEIDEASIDEIIFNLIELRNKRRPHLPQSAS